MMISDHKTVLPRGFPVIKTFQYRGKYGSQLLVNNVLTVLHQQILASLPHTYKSYNGKYEAGTVGLDVGRGLGALLPTQAPSSVPNVTH